MPINGPGLMTITQIEEHGIHLQHPAAMPVGARKGWRLEVLVAALLVFQHLVLHGSG